MPPLRIDFYNNIAKVRNRKSLRIEKKKNCNVKSLLSNNEEKPNLRSENCT